MTNPKLISAKAKFIIDKEGRVFKYYSPKPQPQEYSVFFVEAILLKLCLAVWKFFLRFQGCLLPRLSQTYRLSWLAPCRFVCPAYFRWKKSNKWGGIPCRPHLPNRGPLSQRTGVTSGEHSKDPGNVISIDPRDGGFRRASHWYHVSACQTVPVISRYTYTGFDLPFAELMWARTIYLHTSCKNAEILHPRVCPASHHVRGKSQ